MLESMLVLVVVLPIVWLTAEFFNDRALRIVLGVCAIGSSFGVAWIVGSLDRLASNVYFSKATKDLIQNTIIELENNKADLVLTELRNLRDNFRPTKETRDDYDVLVDRYIHAISKSPVQHHHGDDRWSHEKAE